jgi:hypothetical protein
MYYFIVYRRLEYIYYLAERATGNWEMGTGNWELASGKWKGTD